MSLAMYRLYNTKSRFSSKLDHVISGNYRIFSKPKKTTSELVSTFMSEFGANVRIGRRAYPSCSQLKRSLKLNSYRSQSLVHLES